MKNRILIISLLSTLTCSTLMLTSYLSPLLSSKNSQFVAVPNLLASATNDMVGRIPPIISYYNDSKFGHVNFMDHYYENNKDGGSNDQSKLVVKFNTTLKMPRALYVPEVPGNYIVAANQFQEKSTNQWKILTTTIIIVPHVATYKVNVTYDIYATVSTSVTPSLTDAIGKNCGTVTVAYSNALDDKSYFATSAIISKDKTGIGSSQTFTFGDVNHETLISLQFNPSEGNL